MTPTPVDVLEDAFLRGGEVEIVVASCVKTCCGGKTQKYEGELTARGRVTYISRDPFESYFTMQVRWLGRLGTLVAEYRHLLDCRPVVD